MHHIESICNGLLSRLRLCVFVLTVAVVITSGSRALATDLSYTFGGNASWFLESTATHDGIDAYQSGAISNSQSSWMEATVTGPGAIRFWWKVSSESCCDPLNFTMDGVSQVNIRGNIDWQLKAFSVPAGSHALRWTYSTDGSVLTGSNAGWVDEISFEEGSNIDVTPPVTTASPAGGTVSTPQTVTLSTNEPASIYYTTDGSTPTTSSTQYTAPINISITTTLKFFAVDTSGNNEQTKTTTYTFDTTPPDTYISHSSGTYSGRRDVSLYCSDSGMGCAATYYCLGSGCTPTTLYSSAIAITASTDLRYYSIDRAGNNETVKTSTYTITPDTTPPTTAPGYASGTYGPFYAYLSCSDGVGSGCAGTYYCLGAECTPNLTYSSSVHITTTTDFRFYSQDRSGNSEAIETVSYLIDQTPPVTTANPPGGSYQSAPMVTLACSDGAGTGCSRTYYCTGASCTPSTLYSSPIPINDSTVLHYYSVDNASNNETIITQSYVNPSQPKTIEVPGMRSTIQSAIDAAYNGDTVLVAPGTYVENINFRGKAITVTSSDGPEVTIIDGNRAGSAVTFSSGENLSAVLNGFTIRNGTSTWQGGGIYIDHTSPTVQNNKIISNSAYWGAGVYVGFGSPLIRNNTISFNNNSTYGGGISIGGAASAQIVDNIISNNRSSNGGGISLWAAGTPLIKGNLIINNFSINDGGGIWIVNGSSSTIVQNLIANNSGVVGGGVYGGSNNDTFVNNTIVNNTSSQGASVYIPNAPFVNNIVASVTGQAAMYRSNSYLTNFSHNIMYSPSGNAYAEACPDQNGINGNITADPRLSNTVMGYYGLMAGSPAIDAGDNSTSSLPATELDGMPRIVDGNSDGTAIVDIGAYEFDPTRPVATLLGIPTGFLTVNSLNITVGGTGVVSYRYALDGGAFTITDIAVATPINLTSLANGQHSIVVLGKNALGREQLLSSATAATWVVNTETTNLTFNYGGTAPWFVQPLVSHDGIAYQSGSIFNNQSSWMETTVTGPGAIRFWWRVSSASYSDYLSFKIDGVTQSNISGEVDWQSRAYIVPSGSHTLRWNYSTDSYIISDANSGWVDQIIFEQGADLDIIQPSTTVTPAAGMYGATQNVSLTCTDNGGSGCTGTFYCLDSACNPNIQYSGAITISSATNLRFYSIDASGNGEDVTTAAYSFDTVPPTTSTSLAAGTYSGVRDVTLYCNDSGMGCEHTYYCLGSGCTPTTLYSSPITISSTNDLRYYSIDRGGNSETVRTSAFIITPDVTVPTTTPTYPSGSYSPMTTYLYCSDGNGSGCAGTYYCQGNDCTPTTLYSGSIYVSTSTVIRFYSVDRSGNSEPVNTLSYTIDANPPSTTPTPGGGIYTAPQNVTLACNDSTGSGCSHTYYCLGTGCYPSTPYGGPIAISASTYLTFYSKDVVLNDEVWKSVRYNIASSPPVTINVPADRATIQSAIDAANDGDSVLVAPGTYIENINFKGKAITVQSSKGPDTTIIDGNQQGSVVVFSTNEWNTSILSGFTIRNGGPPPGYGSFLNGGGIYIYGASPTINNNKIIQNQGANGAGIYASGSPIIRGNLISGNSRAAIFSGGFGGGGIFLWGDSAQLVDNTISNNSITYSDGGGIHLRGYGKNLIYGNIISNNGGLGVHGGGIYVDNSTDTQIVQNLITDNRASLGGGVFFSRGAVLVNNTIAENDAADGSGIYVDRYSWGAGQFANNIITGKTGQTSIHSESSSNLNPPLKNNIIYSLSGNIFGGTYTDQNGINGNITADPQLSGPSFGYYGLRPGSPAIDAGDNTAPSLPATDLLGLARSIDGNGVGTITIDIGAYEYDPAMPHATLSGGPSGFTSATDGVFSVGGDQIVSYRYSVDGAPFTTDDTSLETAITLTGLTDGPHSVAVLGKNTLGHEQLPPYAAVVAWHIDTTAPVTSAPPTGWLKSTQGLTLTCTDGTGSGCTTTYYCLGIGCTPTAPYSTPIAISSPTELRFYSLDLVGNSEAVKTVWYIIDNSPPLTSASPAGGTYSLYQNVSLSCNDNNGSGCTGIWYCLGTGCDPSTPYNGAIPIYYSTDLRFLSRDVAGNSEAVSTVSYVISYPLTITESGSGSGTVTGPNISCTTGSSSGCSSVFDGGAMVTLTATPAADSVFTGWGGACSYNIGNQCTLFMYGPMNVTAVFSTAPPVTTLTIDPPAPSGVNGWYVTTPTVTMSSDKQGTSYYWWGHPGGYDYSRQENSWVPGGDALDIRGDLTGNWYDLPFGFTFYGMTYTRVFLSTKGLMRFDAPDTSYDNNGLNLNQKVAIAPLWDDLMTVVRDGDDIYVFQPDPDSVGFRWQAVTYFGQNDTNFEAILYRDGRIRFNYGTQTGGLSPTIGISKGDGVTYQVAYDYNLDTTNTMASILYTPVTLNTYTTAVAAPSGYNMLNYFSVGTSNNAETVRSQQIKVDTVSPATAASGAGGTYNTAQSVSLTCNDGTGSGCASTFYCLGTGCTPATPYTSAVTIANSTDVRFYSTDGAGNNEPIQTTTYTILDNAINLTVTGTGAGTVVSTPNGIATNASTSTRFTDGSSVTLHAIPAAYSIFGGWSGDCVGTTDCLLTMVADRWVTAAFTKDTAHSTYISSGGGTYYPTIQAAYNAAVNSDIIRLWGTEFSGKIACTLNKRVTLSGGYNELYTAQVDTTIIRGSLTISKGSLIINRLAIR